MSAFTIQDLYNDPIAIAELAAADIARRTGIAQHDIALVMGSGWVSAVDALGKPAHEFDAHDVPGFLPPAVEGHSGKIRSYAIQGEHGIINALVFLGRTHLYEGKGIEPVVHSARTAVKAGCKILILTNACGGINKEYRLGQPVLIRDHISLTATSPLIGAQFVDLTDLYSKRIRAIVKAEDTSLQEGVYVHWRGPTYETPAEILMMRTMGADLVGMSTVPEAIAAHALGAEVLGISLVTNAAAGVTGEKLNHEEVIAAGKAAADRMGALLKGVIPKLL
ncbi:MAG: purine-nucleoside phosphorylase [Streptomycetaceae bacterium]|nr:MAG: purine-nucleoside phosphorylase [Streptomycetaceae bacterium]